MNIAVYIVNAFTVNQHGGNRAGVVLQADQLALADKLAIAQRVGLSKTAFVSVSSSASFKLEFFTPTRQIAHCGHATIAAFGLLKQLGLVTEGWSSKETIDGLRQIHLSHNQIYMQQSAPRYTELPAIQTDILASLGLTQPELGSPIYKVNTGNSFALVRLNNLQTLAQVKPNLTHIAALSEQLDLIGYYLFTLDTHEAEPIAATRMFAPRFGIAEEAATGMAAGPLACLLHDKLGYIQTQFSIEQGYDMPNPSPSVIQVQLQLSNQTISSLMAGGSANIMQRIVLSI